MGRVTYSLLSVVALAAGLAFAQPVHSEDDPVKSLTLTLEGACDPKNSRLFVESKHPTKNDRRHVALESCRQQTRGHGSISNRSRFSR